MIYCRNPSLGLATKARACKVVGQEGSLRVKENAREWTLTLPKEPPLWELESKWTPECLESDYKGQNPIAQVLYTIGNLLKHRCLKWACMTHLDIWNTSYGQKKGRESNWQFDSWPLKVKNRLNFLMCRWCVTYRWKALNKGYNFILDLISIGGLHTKLWGPKAARDPILVISGLPFGSLGTKSHLDVGLVERHRVYYKGEGDGFPQVRTVMNFVSASCLWLILAPKCSNYALTTLCWFCVSLCE